MIKLFLLLVLGCTCPAWGGEGPIVDPPIGCTEGRPRGVNCLAEMNKLFVKIDKEFVWTDDKIAWGQAEYWATPEESKHNRNAQGKIMGDCDDFALLIRDELDKRGIENRLIYAITDTGGGHLVVSVGDYILDSKLDMVVERTALPYKWISQSGTKRGDPWRKIIGWNK